MVWLDEPEGARPKSNPLPDRDTNAPEVNAMLLTVRLPLCAPGLVGANSTRAVQLAPAASVEVQVVLTSRKPAVTPREKLPRLFTLSGLVRVTVTGLLSRPTPVCGKAIRLGSACTEPGVPPVPLSGIIVDVVSEVDAMVSVPVYGPLSEGKKITPVEQLAPEARLVPHVSSTRLKGSVAVSVSKLAAEPPLLVSVTVCDGLDWPGVTIGNASCAALTLSPAGVCPVPLSETLTAATPEVDELTTSEADAPPPAVGVKITCTVQLLPLARVAPQVVEPYEKLLAESPLIWKPTLASGAPPVLLAVTVCDELAWPTVCAEKIKLGGLTPNTGCARPVPLKATVWV